MTVPTSYTESTLASYMIAVLGATGVSLELAAADMAEPVNETLLQYGTDDISTVTGTDNLKKLRALARVQAWTQAAATCAADFDFSADGGSYKRDQLYAHVQKMLEGAQTDAMQWDINNVMDTATLNFVDDPYQYRPDEDREL